MALPTLVSDYAYVLNRYNGQVLYTKSENTQNGIASLTKIFSNAKIVRDIYPTEERLESFSVTVDADTEAIGGTGDSDIFEGDIWNGLQLMNCSFLPSSNEATDALTRYVAETDLGASGTAVEVRAAWADFMNTQVTAFGLTSTTFTNSWSGGTSTAKEVTTYVDYVCDWPVMRSIWGKTTETLSITRNSLPHDEVVNSDLVHLNDTGVLGSKSGFGAGEHLVTLWKAPNGNEIIVTTLRAPNFSGTDKEEDFRDIVAQLPIDYPYLSGPSNVALPDP